MFCTHGMYCMYCRYLFALECTHVLHVSVCIGMYSIECSVFVCICLYLHVLYIWYMCDRYSFAFICIYVYVMECIVPFNGYWLVLDCNCVHWYILICTGMHWHVLYLYHVFVCIACNCTMYTQSIITCVLIVMTSLGNCARISKPNNILKFVTNFRIMWKII